MQFSEVYSQVDVVDKRKSEVEDFRVLLRMLYVSDTNGYYKVV